MDFSDKFMDSGIAALYLHRNTIDGWTWPSLIESPFYFSDKQVEIVSINGSLTNYYMDSKKFSTTAVGKTLRYMLHTHTKKLVWTKEEGVRRVLESTGRSVFLLEKPFADWIVASEIGCRLKDIQLASSMKTRPVIIHLLSVKNTSC